MKSKYFLSFIISLIISSVSYADEIAQKSPRFIVHLLDYLAKDYAGAVSEDGKVLSKSEYDEQVEFGQSVLSTSENIEVLHSNEILQGKIKNLVFLILDKSAPSKVAPLARELQREVIEVTELEIQPVQWPVLENGKSLYAQNCVSCHGVNGRGDGLDGKDLDPKPANFFDPDRTKSLSPFAAFNTIRLGVPGTGMLGFDQFSDQEVWALAFYVNSLRFLNAKTQKLSGAWNPDDKNVLKKVATLNDSSLKELVKGDEEFKNTVVASLRLYSGKDDQVSFLQVARTKLTTSLTHYKNGEFEQARTNALQAYLEGIEPVEAKVRASDPDAVAKIEEKMSAVRAAIEAKLPINEIEKTIQTANKEIDSIAELTATKEISPWVAFLGAFGIILREGFEAVLIILALLGVIRATGEKKAARYVHSGWISALGLGFIAWFFSGWLMKMSGASREMMEGVSSVLAVIVLTYVGFWLHRQTEIGRWKKFLEVKVKGFLDSEKLIGLAGITFVATFREAFETVLFLRAIWVDADIQAKSFLGIGVISALFFVIGLSAMALKYTKTLPLKKLFNFSSLIMLALATILAGKGLHSLQEAGVLSVTSLPIHFRIDLVGVYPTIQTMMAQVLTFVLVLGLWVYGNRPMKKLEIN